MRTHFRAFADLSRYFHQNSKSSLKRAYLQHCTFHDKRARVHPASCFPAQLLVCYLQLCNQALIWGKCGFSREMRPICGPFNQFSPHADRVRNCEPLRKHWLLKTGNTKKPGGTAVLCCVASLVFCSSTYFCLGSKLTVSLIVQYRRWKMTCFCASLTKFFDKCAKIKYRLW